jgi:hypothetical protein
MSSDSVRLNYTISESINRQLSSYCELTGRTASDLVRQLVSETLEFDRPLPASEAIALFIKEGDKRERRTDMWMSARHLAALDEMLNELGYPSKSSVIAYLLDDFLNARANHAGDEMVRISLFVDRLTYTKLLSAASDRRQPVEELVAEACSNYVSQGQPGS